MNWKSLALAVFAAALLAGLFFEMRPDSATPVATLAPTAEPTPAPATPHELAVEWEIENGHRIAGPEIVAAIQGQTLRLRLTSNKADELHLHGYDRTVKISAGTPAELTVELTLSGRFEFELHHAHGVLAVLEVQPQLR